MRHRHIIISLFALLQATLQSPAATFHVIGIFDTTDQNIGLSMRQERAFFENEMKTIAHTLELYDCDNTFDIRTEGQCSKRGLLDCLSELSVEPDDVVLFYYGGHGGRNPNDRDPFPQMCLGSGDPDLFVPASLVRNEILNKGPRLLVMLTGCCNSADPSISVKTTLTAMSGGCTRLATGTSEFYRKLLLESRGLVMMTSSKAGEYSYAVDGIGSVFSGNLWLTLSMLSRRGASIDWQTVCQTLQNTVSQKAINTKDGPAYQHPYFEIDPNAKGKAPKPKTDNDTPRHGGSPLDTAIAALLDKGKSEAARLNEATRLQRQLFANGDKVVTVGRDLTTIVDYEDAADWAHRVAASPFITHINVVSDEQGQNRVITVHEIRQE